MKNIKYKEVRIARIKKGYSAKDVVNLINPMRLSRGAKAISEMTYYKKEKGEIPVYIEEAYEIAYVLGKSYKIFFNEFLS